MFIIFYVVAITCDVQRGDVLKENPLKENLLGYQELLTKNTPSGGVLTLMLFNKIW